MRWLPYLPAPFTKVGLPLPAATAECLLDVLLAPETAAIPDRLAEALQVDPALALWAVLRSPLRNRRESPPTLAQLAADLAELLPTGLVPIDTQRGEPVWLAQDRPQVWTDLALRSVATARLAAQLSADDKEADAERAYALGLLSTAPSWLVCAAGDSADELVAHLPVWLQAGLPDRDARGAPPEAVCVRRAAEQFASGHAPNDTIEQARLWWSSTSRLQADPADVACRLARFAQLESRFDEAVQQEKLRAMYTLAAGAGHEINNPLGSIAGRAQLLLRDETDPQRRRTLAKINTQAFRAHEMISDMMLFARPPEPVRAPLDLATVIDAVIDELRETAAERNTELVRRDIDPAVTVVADRSQLMVAVRAICTNSLEALGSGGHIELSVQAIEDNRHGPAAAILVRDNGPGITSEQRGHLFDPFYSGREAGRGLGFGLSKCWRIVTAHGGRIDVESSPGRGATFVITLPAA